MNAGPEYQADARLSVGEIAEVAGVSSPAVSNWRRRHQDFPAPVDSSAAGDVFLWRDVKAWLQKAGKKAESSVPWDRVLWKAADAVRGQVEISEVLVTWLQLLAMRRAASEQAGADRELGHAWDLLAASEDPVATWNSLSSEWGPPGHSIQSALAPTLDYTAEMLGTMLKLIANLSPIEDMGAIATGLLRRYEASSSTTGSLLTPSSVTRLMVDLASPVEGSVYDPACGVGMILADAWRERTGLEVSLYGQEVSERAWRLAFLHLYLLGAEFELRLGDTLRHDAFRGRTAERVLLEPPWGLTVPSELRSQDSRWIAGVPRKSADWLWVQHAVSHLAATGRGIVALPSSALDRNGDSAIREKLVGAGYVDAVIQLPPGSLPATNTPPALLVLSGTAEQRGDGILFVDAKQLGETRRGQALELTDDERTRIRVAIDRRRAGSDPTEPRFAAVVPMDGLLAGASLSPARYVRYVTRVETIEGEPIPRRAQRLATEYAGLLDHALDAHRTLAEAAAAVTPIHETDWTTVRLGDLLTEPPKTGSRQDTEGADPSVPYVTTKSVGAGGPTLQTIPPEFTQGKTRGRFTRSGDLLLISRGIESDRPIHCAFVEFDGEAAYSESLMRLAVDQSAVNPVFLRLFLTSQQGKQALVAASTGSVISNLRPNAVEELVVSLPDRRTQDRLVAVIEMMRLHLGRISHAESVGEEILRTVQEGFLGGLLSGGSAEAAEG